MGHKHVVNDSIFANFKKNMYGILYSDASLTFCVFWCGRSDCCKCMCGLVECLLCCTEMQAIDLHNQERPTPHYYYITPHQNILHQSPCPIVHSDQTLHYTMHKCVSGTSALNTVLVRYTQHPATKPNNVSLTQHYSDTTPTSIHHTAPWPCMNIHEIIF